MPHLRDLFPTDNIEAGHPRGHPEDIVAISHGGKMMSWVEWDRWSQDGVWATG